MNPSPNGVENLLVHGYLVKFGVAMIKNLPLLPVIQ
jgi:hypothetical protein